jgi:hypothetical protein
MASARHPVHHGDQTFCMGDHGIVSSYRPDATGTIQPVLLPPRNDPAHALGLALYRSTLYAFITALDPESGLPGDDMRLLAHHLLDAFWCHPTPAEARAWGNLPTTATPPEPPTHPLVRPFTAEDQTTRGDRAWLAESLAMSTPAAQAAYLLHAPNHELAGAPETDLHKRPSAAIIFRGTFHGLSSLSAGRMCWFSVDLRFQTLPLTMGVLLFTQVKALKDGG